MNSFKKNDYIDLMEIAKRVWAHKFLLIALAVVMAVLAAVRVEFFTKDRYVASGVVYVSNKGVTEDGDELSLTDINTSKSMANACSEILGLKTFLASVSEDIDNKYSWSQIKSMTSVSSLNGTEMMVISATAGNPKDAYLVAESMVRNAPATLGNVFKNGSVEIIDEVVLPSGPVSKGTAGEAAKGAVVGLFLGAAIIVIMNLFDTKIHKGEDVAKRYDVSILGEIAQ